MSNIHTVIELVNSEARIQQLADMGLAYSTIKIDPATDIPQTLINLRRAYRNNMNHDSGQDATQKTVGMNQHSPLNSAIYINSNLLEYPHFLRLIWCDESRQIFCSYYADTAKCLADVRTKKKAVSFLNEYIPRALAQYNPQYWRDIVAEQVSLLSFSPDTEGWTINSTNNIELGVEIYGHNELCKGGSDSVSCMTTSTKGSLWHTELETGRTIHPIYAYLESPDVRLCYITDKTNKYIARWIAPVGADKYTAVYAENKNYQHVITMLKNNNWQHCNESLQGCRLAVINTSEHKVLMPYIDSYTNHLDIDNQSCGLAFLTNGTGYDCDHSTGTANGYGNRTCECCGDRIMGEAAYIESTDETVCECCATDNYTYAHTGRRGEMYVSNDRNLYYYNGEHYTTSGLAWNDLVVLNDGDVCSQDEAVNIDGDYYHIDACQCCPISGEYFLSGSGREVEGVESSVSLDAYNEHCTCGQFDILYNMEKDSIPTLEEVIDSIRGLMDDAYVLNEDSIGEQYNTIVADLLGSTDEDTIEEEAA